MTDLCVVGSDKKTAANRKLSFWRIDAIRAICEATHAPALVCTGRVCSTLHPLGALAAQLRTLNHLLVLNPPGVSHATFPVVCPVGIASIFLFEVCCADRLLFLFFSSISYTSLPTHIVANWVGLRTS